MKVSVIMCSYNTEAFIQEAIECIIQQSYTDWELIISDDKSSDNTVSIIKSFNDSRIKLYEHSENVGYVANKNRAFSYANGNLLTQLDADDICPPDRLEKQVAVFEKHTDIKICGTNYSIINTEGKTIQTWTYDSDDTINELMLNYPFWFPGLMFRKELTDEFGMFSIYFNGIYGDDHYWAMRVNKKYTIYFLKDALYGYRINPNSLTNVFNNPRKLIAQDIIAELHRQLTTNGSDYISGGDTEKMMAFEQSLFNDKKLMAERYRMWAAKAIDKKQWGQAADLLKQSLRTGKADSAAYRTLFYYFKKRYLGIN
ncbi:hypothetical protein CAP35_00975 [Chitinophagaceae bacterium IBVUCB1]|nr:hypothetical protein CAP35_00975 [Chitinophagaceae bacterium IBVUCB1]